jgi:hypothetical protein
MGTEERILLLLGRFNILRVLYSAGIVNRLGFWSWLASQIVLVIDSLDFGKKHPS